LTCVEKVVFGLRIGHTTCFDNKRTTTIVKETSRKDLGECLSPMYVPMSPFTLRQTWYNSRRWRTHHEWCGGAYVRLYGVRRVELAGTRQSTNQRGGQQMAEKFEFGILISIRFCSPDNQSLP